MMETKDIVATIVAAIALVVSLVALWVSYRRTRSAERSFAEQMAGSARVAILDFIIREYLEREFKMTQPKINGKVVETLREARQHAKKKYKDNSGEWNEASKRCKEGAWQNAVAFEIAWVLEHLGAAAFSGALPLRIALAIVGDVVIDDWALCRSWIESYRKDEEATSQVQTTLGVHYHRRHAEWLALIATLWMARDWHYHPNGDHVAKLHGDTLNDLKEKVRNLSCADRELMPASVRSEIKSLTGVRVSRCVCWSAHRRLKASPNR